MPSKLSTHLSCVQLNTNNSLYHILIHYTIVNNRYSIITAPATHHKSETKTPASRKNPIPRRSRASTPLVIKSWILAIGYFFPPLTLPIPPATSSPPQTKLNHQTLSPRLQTNRSTHTISLPLLAFPTSRSTQTDPKYLSARPS
jgi:hypothetical protein